MSFQMNFWKVRSKNSKIYWPLIIGGENQEFAGVTSDAVLHKIESSMEICGVSCEIEGMSVWVWLKQSIYLTISKHQPVFGFIKHNKDIFKNK